jgi:hypothetical protein
MSNKNTYPFLSLIRNSLWLKACLFLTLLNFLNLSVNFNESEIALSDKISLDDPIDTLGELVYEWALDGDGDVIPDNGTEQEDKSIKKDKWIAIYLGLVTPALFRIPSQEFSDYNLVVYQSHISIQTPPPNRS